MPEPGTAENAGTAGTSVTAAPERLVEGGSIILGNWTGFPGNANLIDVHRPYHYPLPRAVKNLRLKEWQAIQAGDDRWFVFAVLYDAKFLSMASIVIYDRMLKKDFGFRHLFPGSRFPLSPRLMDSDCGIRNSHDYLHFSMDRTARRLNISASSYRKRRTPFSIELSLDLAAADSAPFSVCLPLGLNRAMYSTKILMPCSGRLAAGDTVHEFSPERASGILDNHKGFYPWQLHYDWVTGFGMDKQGRRVGFNLTDNQVKDQERWNENRLWIDGKVHALPPIKITRPYGRQEAWIIHDTEGMVDLTFIPESKQEIRVNLGLADIDYAGPFGRFEGSLRSPDGETIDARKLFGMGEEKSLRL